MHGHVIITMHGHVNVKLVTTVCIIYSNVLKLRHPQAMQTDVTYSATECSLFCTADSSHLQHCLCCDRRNRVKKEIKIQYIELCSSCAVLPAAC